MLEMLVEPSRFLVLGVLDLFIVHQADFNRAGKSPKNDYPVVMTKSLLLNMAIEIVDLPNLNMVDLSSSLCKRLPGRVNIRTNFNGNILELLLVEFLTMFNRYIII